MLKVILENFVKEAYIDSNKIVNQLAVIIVNNTDEFIAELEQTFPIHKTIIYVSKAKPITETLIKAIENRHLIFLVIDDVLDEVSFKNLESIKNEGYLDTILPHGKFIAKKLAENQLIFLVGTRDRLESQYDNLINLGGQFLDLV